MAYTNMIKLYAYDLKRDPDGHPIYAYPVATWQDAIEKACELHKEEGIRIFHVSERFSDGKFLTGKLKFD